ncbi:MAG: ATP-binding protein [Rhodothermales bacterium]
MAIRDYKLGTKQSLGFGVILVFMAAVSIFAIFQMVDLRKDIDDFNKIWLERSIVISRLNINAFELRTYQLELALVTDEDEQTALANAMATVIDQVINVIDEGREIYLADTLAQASFYTKEAARLFSKLDASWEQYLEQSLDYYNLEDEDAKALLMEEAGSVFDTFSKDIAAFVKLNQESAANAANSSALTYTSTRNRIVLLLVLTIVLSGVIAAWLVRLITIPVHKLVKAVRKVADGNLDVHLESESRDEIGTLTRSFNWMTKSLMVNQEDLESKKEALEEALHQLRETQHQLVVKEKIASLGQLTSGIAHEIKNPLNFINNFSQLSVELADDLKNELEVNREQTVGKVIDEVADLLNDLVFNTKRINEHGKRADSIVMNMMQHARGGTGERQSVDLNVLLDEYVNLAYHGMRVTTPDFQVTITRDYDDSVGEVDMVREEISRVFLNIINNAFYAVHEQAQTHEKPYAPAVTVTTCRLEKSVEIRIEDNGLGIPTEIQEKIFEPFFTTKPTGTGTGLGLSLSHDIIKGHGGTLLVESIEGQGATFILKLAAVSA